MPKHNVSQILLIISRLAQENYLLPTLIFYKYIVFSNFFSLKTSFLHDFSINEIKKFIYLCVEKNNNTDKP